MKLTIEINLGNDSMQTFQDLRDALKEIGSQLGSTRCCMSGEPTIGDGGRIANMNGNSVGAWAISDDEEQDDNEPNHEGRQ